MVSATAAAPFKVLVALLCSALHVFGLVNVAPTAGGTTLGAWRGRGGHIPLFAAPARDSSLAAAAPSGMEVESTNEVASASPLQDFSERTTQPATTQNPLDRKGVWMPPSKNAEQRRGLVFSIQQPQDLLDFVVEDERLSVVKVYASWCKTCKVFDMRYRKLASQLGDKYDDAGPGPGDSAKITREGRVRFAEMMYDDPMNEEMCKLLNATKLPYILMYKGSKGKVKDFQCSPSKFQMLIDAVNEFADPAAEGSISNGAGSDLRGDDFVTSSAPVDTTTPEMAQDTVYNGEEYVESLKQQLATLEEEKLEMFEVMKAQIEHDKVYIKKLETGVETQRSILEAKDGEIFQLQSTLGTKEDRIGSLTNKLDQQRKKTQQTENELSGYQTQVSQLTERISEIEETVTSIECQSSIKEEAAEEQERLMLQQMNRLEEQKIMYEKERNSARQLFKLGVKCVGRSARSFVCRMRRKGNDR